MGTKIDIISALLLISTQAIITVVPFMLLYYFTRKYFTLARWELYMVVIPWAVSLASLALFRDERYFDHGTTAGIISGFVLLPRLVVAAQSQALRVSMTIIMLVATTAYAVAYVMSVGPAVRY